MASVSVTSTMSEVSGTASAPVAVATRSVGNRRCVHRDAQGVPLPSQWAMHVVPGINRAVALDSDQSPFSSQVRGEVSNDGLGVCVVFRVRPRRLPPA
jgi:hypothetical protein